MSASSIKLPLILLPSIGWITYARREEQERQERLEQQAEEKAAEEAEKARQQAELDATKAKYFGWADTMTPLRFGKVRSKLEGLIRHEGKVMQLRDFIVSLVRDGWDPVQQDGVTFWYGSKWSPKQSKPRTERTLSKGEYSYKVSKTEYDFAVYLTEHREILKQG